jgi:hypothetical protein
VRDKAIKYNAGLNKEWIGTQNFTYTNNKLYNKKKHCLGQNPGKLRNLQCKSKSVDICERFN